ncbi:MAG: FlgD immunoglobulin-like domain containing protein, partial [candidate division Zixibacteria bacterium]|nr:FlgD immunoglobulin-like domain containing protein [candidate division Zixibacteria bacterium]
VEPNDPDFEGYDRVWSALYRGGFAWNFDFSGDSVFAATDSGLLLNATGIGTTWDTIPLVDDFGDTLVLPGTPVVGVKKIEDYVWVGTDNGTVRMEYDGLGGKKAFFVIDSATTDDEVYAFPVPFSHSNAGSGRVDFHFVVDEDARVTLEIYDFAMNLVSRVIDNVEMSPGVYPAYGPLRYTWDGRNGRGEQVAVGVYYFKVEYSTGEVRWGKLAVVP